MNHDRLRLDLAGLADEVTPVDLRDRALRTSRRLGIQRAVATSATALVLLAAATGTAFAIRPDGGAPAPGPAGPSVTASWPPVEVTPTPAPTASPPAATTSEPAATATIGRVFYGPAPDNSSATTARLRSWKPGGVPVDLLSVPRTSALANAAVSPDGERVAWVDRDANLWVADVNGSGREVRAGVEGDCWGPTWSPDSKRLALALVDPATPGAGRRGVLNLASNTFTEVGKVIGCHPLWSANGKVFAFPDGSTGQVTMTTPDGAGQWFIPKLGGNAKYDCFDVASLSPDGSRIALFRRGPGENSGDVARELDVDAVLDTHTGEQLDLPIGARTLLQAFFQVDGTLVARVGDLDGNILVLISADGRKISESREPASFRDMQILHVAG
ncbi:hypothetical protein EV384_0837 [Micromonospora kangleipakensis]|uniref:WD40 repeat protein n=1 Tax=Micromonospora kangleipakensis TaxID=1077942 RepID=A0A4Q8B4J0_9ACTN|nr:hypothetical protein [Micromonospora kangleipakensis]RZU72470.1 hypothetical protein EV384_0837 [Micromonospora kangleipakensis]